MSNLGKRNAGFVDLTGDDQNTPPRRKKARVTVNQPQGSQPQASQSLSGREAWTEADEDNEVLDLTQDADEGAGWTCVGAIDGKIVGIRYYNGLATPGENVLVKREPNNPYDSNAIRISNVHGAQIGHLPRQIASKLASYMVSFVTIFPSILLTRVGHKSHSLGRRYRRRQGPFRLPNSSQSLWASRDSGTSSTRG